MPKKITDITRISDGTPIKSWRIEKPVERLIDGTPDIKNHLFFADKTGRFNCGIWEGGPAKWRVYYDEDEFYYLIEGSVTIADEDGNGQTYKPGDVIVVPSGFVGTWEVHEYARKYFAHFKPDAG